MIGLIKIPWSHSLIVVLVGGLALFLITASQLLISHGSASAIHDYLLGVDHLRTDNSVSLGGNQTKSLFQWREPPIKRNHDVLVEKYETGSELPMGPISAPTLSTDGMQHMGAADSFTYGNGTDSMEQGGSFPSGFINDSREITSIRNRDNLDSSKPTLELAHLSSAPPNHSVKADLRSCDLYRGKWIYDPAGPLYTNNTCPVLTQSQNCQGNGRPDKDYENWRWKPNQCDLPRFDARKFLELLKGKTLAFVGDSIARNQMESMLCILWQAEAPKNRGNHHMHRWVFRSTSTTIVRIWSAWLVHKTTEALQYAPKGVVKVHLDTPDEAFMEFLPKFDIMVLSSGHWFAKQTVYVLDGTIVGGQLWQPKRTHRLKVNNVKAFGISVETILTAIATHPNYTGLTLLRSYTPDHYEGGAWNSGGSCSGNVRPASKLARNEFTDVMHEKQVAGFKQAMKKVRNGSKLMLMDITEAFGYRQDGHPGKYRSPDWNMGIRRGPHGKRPREDCLHWCMPGPVDTWNEILFEIIRREFEEA